VVYDIVYNPPTTKTLVLAQAGGAKAVNGLGMLLYQGVIAFEHWIGRTPPADVMREALVSGS
jgi:shikimate dehydrogenase